MRQPICFLTVLIFMIGCDKATETEEIKTDFELFMEQVEGDWQVRSYITPSLNVEIGDWTEMTLNISSNEGDSDGYLSSTNRPTSEIMDVIWPESSNWKESKVWASNPMNSGGGQLIRNDGLVLTLDYNETSMQVAFILPGDYYLSSGDGEIILLESTWQFEFVRK